MKTYTKTITNKDFEHNAELEISVTFDYKTTYRNELITSTEITKVMVYVPYVAKMIEVVSYDKDIYKAAELLLNFWVNEYEAESEEKPSTNY